jgi:succinoglycan biosynthesis transport protein ExoP
MEAAENVRSMGDYVDVLRRRLPFVITIPPAALLVALYLAYTLPPMYRSSATILLEPPSITSDVVKSTVMSDASQRIELVQRTVMSSDRLEALVREYDPYPDQTGLTIEEKAQQVRSNTWLERVDPVTLEPLETSTAFSVHYQNPNPEIAAAVARRVAQLFLELNKLTRTEAAAAAYTFLNEQAESVRERMRITELSLAEFKSQHGGALPETQSRNLMGIDRGNLELMELERAIRAAEEEESLLSLQLEQTSPTLAEAVSASPAELARLRTELAAAQERYKPDHPDVKKLQRAIERMLETQGDSGTLGPPDNPEYIQLRGRLDAARREAAALRSQAGSTRARIRSYEQQLASIPEVEQNYAQLLRQRDMLQSQLVEIQKKLQNAEMAQNLESEMQGERLTLIRSPHAPDSPYSPNRLGLILIGLVLGTGIAAVAVAIAESVDSSVRSVRDVALSGGATVLAALPVITTPDDRSRRHRVWSYVSVAYLVAAVFVGVTVLMA